MRCATKRIVATLACQRRGGGVADAGAIPEAGRPTERALVELSHIPPEEPLDGVFRRACELSAEALGVERVGVWLFIDGRTVLRCANLFERSKDEHSSGAVLQVADFPTYFASLNQRKSVPSVVAVEEPWTAELATEYLEPLGITSMLDAGIVVDGEMVGVVCHEHVGAPPREWSIEDRGFAGSVADLIALKIQSAKVRDLRAAFLTQQRRLSAHDKAVALEDLTAGIAHDFKNLLTAFHIYGKLLSQRTDLPADAREYAKEIYAATERGTALAKELMEFARPTFAPPTVLDLHEAARDCLPTLQAALGPKYEVHYSGTASAGNVLIERNQLARLLLNLTTNASEAMPDGGVIQVRVAPVRRTTRGRQSGSQVLVEVSDQGAGMDAATRRRLFEPYFTTKPKGTGLGMPIVRQIVERVGGFIRVTSAPGRGATVRMYFPTIRSGNPRPTTERPAARSTGS
jgi:two-component system cell cycle sensor histidine kinase/response regulator CckA